MQVIYSDRAMQDRKGYAWMQKASEFLEEASRLTWDPIRAEWNRTEDQRGQVRYTLKLSDFAGEANTDFSPDELDGAAHAELHLYRVLGDLMRNRSRKLLEKIRQDHEPEE
jgi:hypothetical protein